MGTGWERNNRTHFDNIVADYDKIRWDYPDELYEDIFKYSEKGGRALEIGAGTGKATTPFLNAGYSVTAVEMGANMAEFLQKKFQKYNDFNVINATFEDAVLDEGIYDMIYAASAFHWVDAEIGCPKVFRLLKSGGKLILFRNNVYRQEGDSLDVAIEAAYDQHYYSHYPRHDRPVGLSKMSCDDFLKPEEIHRGFRFNSMEQYGFTDVTMKLYNAARTYDADEYLTLVDTYSDHRALPDENRAALYAGIKDAIMSHGGQFEIKFIFQLYMGKKP